MSRIGRQPIPLPAGVTFTFQEGVVQVKGPKGTLSQPIRGDFSITQENGSIVLRRPSDEKAIKALHGLYRALIASMVQGVTRGYEKRLELVGIGYRAEVKGQRLFLYLGYSHDILFILPPEVQAEVIVEKGKNPSIILRCIDKQLLGQVAAMIRKLRPPEPYKGKGIRYAGEVIRLRAGKAGGKGKK
ncbi:MAG: 50S ribosomal protein L6 [Bacteroidia bacterium]